MTIHHNRGRRSGRLATAVVAAGAVVLALTACASETTGDSGHSTASTSPIRVTVTPGIGSLPFRVAQEEGFFEDHGVELEVTEGADFTSYIGALDRQFDAVMLTASTALSAVTAGLPLKVYAGMDPVDEAVLSQPIVTEDPSITSLADLANQKGTLGVLRTTEATKALLRSALEGTGANVDDINLVAVPFTDQMDQLRAGQIDAALSSAGFYEPLLAEGFEVIASIPQDALVNVGAELPVTYVHFVSTPTFVESNLASVQAFQDAIVDAVAWIEENPDAALEVFAEWLGRDPESVQDSVIPAFKVHLTPEDFDPWVQVMEDSGLIEEPIDTSELIIEGLD